MGVRRAQVACGCVCEDRSGSGQFNPLFAANLASKGGLADLEPILPAGTADLYLPAVWEACRDQTAGRIAIPWYLTVRLSLVNHQLLDQAGLSAPPRTWSELPAFLRCIRDTTGRYGLFMTVVPDDSAEMLETLVQMGVQLLDDERRAAFDSPVGRDAFEFWTELYREGCCLGRWSARVSVGP